MKRFSSFGGARPVLIALGATLVTCLFVALPGGSFWSQRAMIGAIDAGLSAALLAAVVLVINVLFRRWLSARQMGLLWGFVLVRLLFPIAPSSIFSLQNLLPPAPVE